MSARTRGAIVGRRARATSAARRAPTRPPAPARPARRRRARSPTAEKVAGYPAPALAHQQRQQQREQEQRQQVRPQHPDARRQRQPDRHQRRARRERADHQPPGQRGGAHDQRRRAELQARHPGHAIDGVTSAPAPAIRDPARARPRSVRIVIDARDASACARCPARRADARTCRSGRASARRSARTPRTTGRRPWSRTRMPAGPRSRSFMPLGADIISSAAAGLSRRLEWRASAGVGGCPTIDHIATVKSMTLSGTKLKREAYTARRAIDIRHARCSASDERGMIHDRVRARVSRPGALLFGSSMSAASSRRA